MKFVKRNFALSKPSLLLSIDRLKFEIYSLMDSLWTMESGEAGKAPPPPTYRGSHCTAASIFIDARASKRVWNVPNFHYYVWTLDRPQLNSLQNHIIEKYVRMTSNAAMHCTVNTWINRRISGAWEHPLWYSACYLQTFCISTQKNHK